MAYGDYGGYADRNGVHVPERSDVAPTLEGLVATPGSYPGWSLPEGIRASSYHALLGDDPIFVGLLKQTSFTVLRGLEEIDPATILKDPDGIEEGVLNDGWIDDDVLAASERPLSMVVDGHAIDVFWTREGGRFVHARLTQPDGTVWTGWSGFGVGAGHEDEGHARIVEERNETTYRLCAAADEPVEDRR